MKRRNSGDLVYSTGPDGRCALCGKPRSACICRKNPRGERVGRGAAGVQGDGVVRVRRESKGRRGKTVTTATGIPLGEEALLDLAGELKRRCGSGGSVKEGVVEIQGDHRDTLVSALEERGYTVKRAGG